MPRPLRIEHPGACYHVVNRGNRRDKVFLSDSDYDLFLEKLGEYAEKYDIVIYSYCLMPNHQHLFLRTLHANLGKFMQSFNTSFTLCVNNRHGKSGHLFQGRYKAQLVETELYKNKLSRYIHLNPVKTTASNTQKESELKKRLFCYRWSSYLIYMDVARKPKWLNRSFVLDSWGKVKEEKIKNYQGYVEKGIRTDNKEEFPSNGISSITGSESFQGRLIKLFLKKSLDDIDEREQPELRKINTPVIHDVITSVAEYFNLSSKDITIRRGCDRDARSIAMHLSVRFCKKITTLATIAAHFHIGVNGISSNEKRCLERFSTNKQFLKTANNIAEAIIKNTETKV